LKSVLFSAILLISYTAIAQDTAKQEFKLDTNKIAVISLEIFGRPYVSLNNEELVSAEQMLRRCVDIHNSSIDSTSYQFVRLEDYFRQYAAYLQNGNKMVWVNCFCRNRSVTFADWKEEPVIVFDGGDCFFQLSINLLKRECSTINISRAAFSK
jgi:hypothetical protein